MEQLKEWFKSERANWDTEKAGLLKRAEDAESALKLVAEELTRLKRQVNAMISAIFGEYLLLRLCECSALKFCRFNMKFLNRCRYTHWALRVRCAEEAEGFLHFS